MQTYLCDSVHEMARGVANMIGTVRTGGGDHLILGGLWRLVIGPGDIKTHPNGNQVLQFCQFVGTEDGKDFGFVTDCEIFWRNPVPCLAMQQRADELPRLKFLLAEKVIIHMIAFEQTRRTGGIRDEWLQGWLIGEERP